MVVLGSPGATLAAQLTALQQQQKNEGMPQQQQLRGTPDPNSFVVVECRVV